jgi:hypothetical protein
MRHDMTDYELWSLVIDTTTAVGTMGAVIVALWVTLRQRVRFKIENIRMDMKYVQNDGEESSYEPEASLCLLVENHLPVPLELKECVISFPVSSTGTGIEKIDIDEPLSEEFVPPLSSIEVKVDLTKCSVDDISKEKIGKIICILKTSAGNKVKKLPKRWREIFFICLEIPDAEYDMRASTYVRLWVYWRILKKKVSNRFH